MWEKREYFVEWVPGERVRERERNVRREYFLFEPRERIRGVFLEEEKSSFFSFPQSHDESRLPLFFLVERDPM